MKMILIKDIPILHKILAIYIYVVREILRASKKKLKFLFSEY